MMSDAPIMPKLSKFDCQCLRVGGIHSDWCSAAVKSPEAMSSSLACPILCMACDPITGEPLCVREATHEHPVVPGDDASMTICDQHACKHCIALKTFETLALP